MLAKVPDDPMIVVGDDVCTGGPEPAKILERLRGLGVRVVDSGSVGRPCEDEPGAYRMLDLVQRRSSYEAAPKPELHPDEAMSLFEPLALGA